MPLESGSQLGPYEILGPLGAGGMGEVYKARDSRLNRTIAIKVLPAHIAERVELRERFEREARAIASFNHPHICVVHDVGRHENIDFLVMEYLEGETLADRIKVLPEAVAADSERVARFEREAKTLAALNHPNIAAIYGFEDSDSGQSAGHGAGGRTNARRPYRARRDSG